AVRAVSCDEHIYFGAADRFGAPAFRRHAGQRPAVHIVRLGGDARYVQQSRRTIARHRRAEMLQRVGTGRAVDALDQRHLPIGAAFAADDAAERTPFREVARLRGEAEAAGRAAAFVEVIAVTRGAAGQSGGKRRRAALEVAAGAKLADGRDPDAG